MNVNNIMDLGGSQSTSKTRSAQSTSKNQAASSDLFKSIIGQKQAGSQQQSGLNVQSAAQQSAKQPQQTQRKDSAVQDTSSKSSAPASGNDSTPADNLDNTAIEDAAAQDAPVSETGSEEPVTEDEAVAAEEAPAEEAEEPVAEEADAPRQIFVMQMPVAAAIAPMAPVIISSETYQADTVDTIANDVVLDEPAQPQILMQVSEAQITVGENVVQVETAEFTVTEEAPQAQTPAGQDNAAIEIAGNLQDIVQTAAEAPKAAAAAVPQQDDAVQTPVQDLEQEVPVQQQQAEQPEAAQTSSVQQPQDAAAGTQPQRTDAADEFAAQVVREARDMVGQNQGEIAQEADLELAEETQTVQAKAEADDTDDAAGKGTEQNRSQTTHAAAMPGTAAVAEDGRVDLRTNAAQPLEAEQYLQPETRQMIMNRVVDQVRSAVTPDRTEFYIQLKPDFLGGLSIGLVAEEKGIVAKIMTTSQQVHSALQADMTALQRVLQERGINVVEMDVIYNQMTDASSKDNSDNRQQQFAQGGNSRSHGRISDQTDDGMTMYDALSAHEVLTENGGSVEFTA